MKNIISVATFAFALILLSLAGCTTTAPTNDSIADEVRENLASNVDLAGQQIVVKVDNGTVTLMGEIANKNQETEAIAMASAVPGVENVVSLLEVDQFGGPPLEN